MSTTAPRLGAHQPQCRCHDAREDLDRQGGEQVRHPVRARARGLCAHRRAARCAAVGVDMHIGSQITELGPFSNAFALMAQLVEDLRAAGPHYRARRCRRRARHPLPPRQHAAARSCRLRGDRARARRRARLQPDHRARPADRGNAGILVTRVEYVKRSTDRTFVIVDAAMNDLIRPTLYEAHHDILPVRASGAKWITADIVGPVCESGDYLARPRHHRRRGRRPARRDDRRRLWRGDGLDLQLAPAGPRGAGRRRPLGLIRAARPSRSSSRSTRPGLAGVAAA